MLHSVHKALTLQARSHIFQSSRMYSSLIKQFATMDPEKMGKDCVGKNLVDGQWLESAEFGEMIDPLNGGTLFRYPATTKEEAELFIKSMRKCPKTGLHNPLRD